MQSEITMERLYARAVAMWGAERADTDRAALELRAAALKVVSENLPAREQQPAFYLE